MKMLKYTLRTVVTEQDMDGNPVEREIFTVAHVPDNENGRALAEKEAYGEITPYDDGKEEVPVLTIEDRVSALERNVTVDAYVVGKWYYRGDKVNFENNNYTCVAPANVVCTWSPVEYPQYWSKDGE